MSMTNPPIYTSWRNLERGQHLAVAGVFDDIHMTNAEAILSLQLENSKLRQCLTAADERTHVLEGLLRKLWHVVPNGYKSEIDAAFKPAEGGGDEAI